MPRKVLKDDQVLARRKFGMAELAAFWHVSQSTAWRLALSGAVPSHRIGKRLFVFADDAQRYVDEHTHAPFDVQQVAARLLQS